MLDKFDFWRHSPTSNCWDFVREFWISKGASGDSMPKFGICPSNKRAMTRASISVIETMIECGPVQNAVACHYHGKLLYHVGVIDNGMVRHSHHKLGCARVTIEQFERMAAKTVYRLPKCLL